MDSQDKSRRGSKKKASVLVQLNDTAVRIHHKLTTPAMLDKNSENHEQMYKSVSKDIHDYVDIALNGLRSEAILSDPFHIVYGDGFDSGSPGEEISNAYLAELQEKDSEGWISAIISHHTIANDLGVITSRLCDGTVIITNSFTNTITFIVNGIRKVFSSFSSKAQEFWVAFKNALASIREWFKSKFQTEQEPKLIDVLA